jgi:hypothetical protein
MEKLIQGGEFDQKNRNFCLRRRVKCTIPMSDIRDDREEAELLLRLRATLRFYGETLLKFDRG